MINPMLDLARLYAQTPSKVSSFNLAWLLNLWHKDRIDAVPNEGPGQIHMAAPCSILYSWLSHQRRRDW